MSSIRLRINKKMGKRIKEKRHLQKMSLERAASLSGLTPSYLSLIEQGQGYIQIKELVLLMEGLDITLDELSNEESFSAQELIDNLDKFDIDKLEVLSALSNEILNLKTYT